MKFPLRLWIWQLARRDLRRGVKPLLLSMSSVILAVAAVVAAFSFRENLQSNIQTQSKSLLGADLALDSRDPFSAEDEALFRSLGGDQSRDRQERLPVRQRLPHRRGLRPAGRYRQIRHRDHVGRRLSDQVQLQPRIPPRHRHDAGTRRHDFISSRSHLVEPEHALRVGSRRLQGRLGAPQLDGDLIDRDGEGPRSDERVQVLAGAKRLDEAFVLR